MKVPKVEKFQARSLRSFSIQIREILSPKAKANNYCMITGERGIGKSSVVIVKL